MQCIEEKTDHNFHIIYPLLNSFYLQNIVFVFRIGENTYFISDRTKQNWGDLLQNMELKTKNMLSLFAAGSYVT